MPPAVAMGAAREQMRSERAASAGEDHNCTKNIHLITDLVVRAACAPIIEGMPPVAAMGAAPRAGARVNAWHRPVKTATSTMSICRILDVMA